MDKLWYPVAFSALIVGCGGDVDTGSSTTTGGSTGVDTGTPTATGGFTVMIAVPYGVIPINTGGSSSAYGGRSGFGGQTLTSTLPIDSGVPAATGGGPIAIYGVR
jgi:hypothetical protein